MIKVSVLYSSGSDARFDMDYYCKTHIPMVQQKLGTACKGVTVEQGVRGAAPGSLPTYTAIAHLQFDSIAEFDAAFAPHAASIMADVPNYTNAQMVVQISEVKI
jgi:uncharacterized protein (TIGR02118 family)